MDSFWGYVISSVLGIITGVLGTVCYNKLYSQYVKRKRERAKKSIQPKNVFETYGKKEVTAIVSFEDSYAIRIEPLLQNGVYLLKAKISLKNKPAVKTNRNFVMALLSYLPQMDWSYHVECGYSFKFKIRGNIKGLQLEIKNKAKRKLLDEYVAVGNNFEEKIFPLSGEISVWQDVEEICFTVFCEDEYIQRQDGNFEIMDCILEK